ncbi:MerR family transcriptional regulator [uncultured Sphingomonas sp.]|uniref:helix-turn-helix domain-containing protein n=1 Tax=uncultured Sphingomonas sp. TaxID=158754 RepID=UPI0035C9C87F
MDTLDIAEVARRTGLTVRALRFYEARGLVAPLRAASGRRFYGAGELARLHAVVALKRAGFSLAEIAAMLRERRPDLGRLVAARLAEVERRAAELAATRTLLGQVQSRLDRGDPIDVATLCSLIQAGDRTMEQENWAAVTDRYLSEGGKRDFAASAYPADFDQAAHAAKWADLAARIEAALPLDPTGDRARAFRREWFELLGPFTAIATPAMKQDVGRLYDHVDEWQGEQTPPFSARVWAFIQSVPA